MTYLWGYCPECGAPYYSASLFGPREAEHDLLCSRYETKAEA